MDRTKYVRNVLLLVFAMALLGVMPMAAANGAPTADEVWQIGDVETIAGGVASTNPADEFNWVGATASGGPNLGSTPPAFAPTFVVGTTDTNMFPYNSNFNRGYATDFDVEWVGELVCGGELAVSWSPGASASETKVLFADTEELDTLVHTPGEGGESFVWTANRGSGTYDYKFFEDTVAVPPLDYGTHAFNFQHTTGDGTFWDWVRLSDNSQTVDLIADGGEYWMAPGGIGWVDVGGVQVWDDGTTLYVKYFTDVPEWRITGIHLEVADSLGEIPATNNGNPKPGKFEVKDSFPYPGVSETPVYEFTLADYPNGPVIAAHANVIDLGGLVDVTDPGMYWATGYSDANQGLRRNGTDVLPERSDPADVLGAPDAVGPPYSGFFSLGFGGSIVVEFGAPIHNGTGDDLGGVEVTSGSYPEESAKVEFLYDGVWHEADAELTNTGSSSLQRATFVGMPATIPFADAVRITDTTDPSAFNSRPTADGYDLDAVKVSQLGSIRDETGWGDGPRFVDSTWAMYFEYISRCVAD